MAKELDALLRLVAKQHLEIGASVSVTLAYSITEGFISPVEISNRPSWLPEEIALPVFQTYMERFQKAQSTSYKATTRESGYLIQFAAKDFISTLTFTKETDDLMPKGRKAKFSPEMKKEILDYLREGHSRGEAADKFDVSTASINIWAAEAGITGKRGRKAGKTSTPKTPKAAKEKAVSGAGGTINLNGTLYIPAGKGLSKAINALEAAIAEVRRELGI